MLSTDQPSHMYSNNPFIWAQPRLFGAKKSQTQTGNFINASSGLRNTLLHSSALKPGNGWAFRNTAVQKPLTETGYG